MLLIQIGDRLINLDRVTSIDLAAKILDMDRIGREDKYASGVILHFGAGEEAARVELVGEEASAFRSWAAEHATGVCDARWKPITVVSPGLQCKL